MVLISPPIAYNMMFESSELFVCFSPASLIYFPQISTFHIIKAFILPQKNKEKKFKCQLKAKINYFQPQFSNVSWFLPSSS